MNKKIVYIAVLYIAPAIYCQEDSVLKTNYIVTLKKDEAVYKTTQSGYTDFNVVANRLIDLLHKQEDKKTVFSTYLKNRLEIMKAISERINSCFLSFMKKKKGQKAAADYLTNTYLKNKEIDVEVRDMVKTMVEELVPCDLVTGTEGFSIVRPYAGSAFSLKTKYTIEQDGNLTNLNHYLEWVETLILLSFSKAEVFKQLDILAPHIFKNYDFAITPQQQSFIMKLRDLYLNQYYMLFLQQAYTKLQALYDDISSNPEVAKQSLSILQLLTVSISLQALVDYNESELRKKAQIHNNSTIVQLDALNDSIIMLAKRVLHGNDADIEELKNVAKTNLSIWIKDTNQLARFEEEFLALKSQAIVSLTAVDLLYQNVIVLAYVLQMQGDNILKYAQLLHDIEDFRKSIMPTNNLLEDLLDLERNLSLLSA